MKSKLFQKAVSSAIAVFCLASTSIANGQQTKAQPPNVDCTKEKCYPSVVIPADHPQLMYYCNNASCSPGKNAYPNDLPISVKNASSLTVRIEGINPLRRSFTVTFNGTKFAEIDGSVFGQILGFSTQALTSIPSVKAATTPTPTHTIPVLAIAGGFEEGQSCSDQFTSSDAHHNVANLNSAANEVAAQVGDYNTAVTIAQNSYRNTLIQLSELTQGSDPSDVYQNKFHLQLDPLLSGNASARNLTAYPQLKPTSHVPDTAKAEAVLSQYHVNPLDTVAADLQKSAVTLHGSLQASISSKCQTDPDAQKLVARDQTFLESLFSPTSSGSSLVDQWTAALKAASAQASSIDLEEENLEKVLDDPGNFEVDARVPPDYRVQSSVTVKVAWTDKDIPTTSQTSANQPASQPATKAQPGESETATPSASQKSSSSANSPSSSSADSSNSTSFTINFGQGPRTFESAGIVFSPLTQHSYAYTSGASSSNAVGGCIPPSGTTSVGCIVDNGGSSWRILPVAIASVRFADVNFKRYYDWRQAIPNYFSFGATIKSGSNSNTNLEYLLGLSCASLGQHVFVTAGTYAGQVDRLGGGLTTGWQTVAPPSTLPVSTPYHFGFGFAITYKIGSQGSSGNKTSNANGSAPSQSPE
jgi:hypothetical protein